MGFIKEAKIYNTNVSLSQLILTPLSKNISKKERITCLVASIAIGVFTLGIAHLSCYIYWKTKKEQPWKIYPNSSFCNKDFSYKKPELPQKLLTTLPSILKSQVEENCKTEMKQAMKALESSLVDAIRSLIMQGRVSSAIETMNQFCNRVMDLYEAYAEIQIEDDVPAIDSRIGVIKSSGFTHQEILNLKKPCTWYVALFDKYKERLKSLEFSESESDKLLDYFASKKYVYKPISQNRTRCTGLETSVKSIIDSHLDPTIKDKIKEVFIDFTSELSSNKKHLNSITKFDSRVTFARSLSQREKEQFKKEIAEMHFHSDPFTKDPQARLIDELRQRFSWRDIEPGYVGSPLRLLNIVRGKHDLETNDSHFRTKLFFVYGSKNIANEICQNEHLIKKINQKLIAKNKEWQLDEQFAKLQRGKSTTQPIYALGMYAKENSLGGNLRHWINDEEVNMYRQQDPNPTYKEIEDDIKKQQNLTNRFRFPLYRTEEMAFFGTNTPLEDQELERKHHFHPRGEVKKSHADSSYFESALDYRKKTTNIPWDSGKYFFKLHGKDQCDSPYLNHIEELGMQRYASISGSTDQMFNIAGFVGIQSQQELMNLRLLFIPWMGAHEDHTADEILTTTKSFHLPYTPAADFYKQIYPAIEPLLTHEIRKEQIKRGYQLPEYYLSQEHVAAKLAELNISKELEALQNKKVMRLMKENQLMMHGSRTYRINYSLCDLFGDEKWKRSASSLSDHSIKKVNEGRKKKEGKKTTSLFNNVRYDLNYQTKTYEPHVRSNPPSYKGSHKESVTLVPPKGKVIPYVPFDYPHLNRVGLLFDANECQFKKEKFVFEFDSNIDIKQKHKKYYSQQEIHSPKFQEKLKKDAKEAIAFNRTYAHHISLKELIKKNKENEDRFVPYNEIRASLHNKGIVGVYAFSRGLPKHTSRTVSYKNQTEKYSWPPLHHESVVEHQKDDDYERYMLLMGIGKKIATKKKFGCDVPLYYISEPQDRGMHLVSKQELISFMHQMLKNENEELEGIVRIIQHQGNFHCLLKSTIKNSLIEKINKYLEEIT